MRTGEPYTTESATYAYTQYALQHRILTKKEEIELGKLSKQGDRKAIDELVKHNLRFVVSVAKSMRRVKAPFEDKLQEGNIGLITAAERFDYERGNRFISYAVWWIRSSIQRIGTRYSHVVEVPVNAVSGNKRAREIAKAHFYRHGVVMDPKELAAVARVALNTAEALTVGNQSILSMSAPMKDYDTLERVDKFHDHSAQADHTESLTLCRITMEKMLRGRSERGIDVVKMYYAIDPYFDTHTLEEIGKKWGLTRERIRQIKEKELDAYRNWSDKSVHLEKVIKEGQKTVRQAERDGLIFGRKGVAV